MVTGLSLASNGLVGTIPSDLVDLTNLETLHLSGNSLSGCVPGALYDVATHDLDSAGISSCDKDKAVLEALYRATDGGNWTNSSNWLSGEPVSSWYGVTIDSEGNVTGVSLASNGLSGTIPSELLDLTGLETLHLSGNSLSGCMPESLYEVATHDLDSAGIPSCDQDKAPLVALYNATGGASWTDSANWLSVEPLGTWHGVTTDGNGLVTGLSLAGNGLSGTIPSELLDLTKLETLHLSGNSLSGCVPGALYDVTTNDLDSAGIPSCDQDKEPLVALYNATAGASWTDSANWLSDEPLGSWHGVTTDGNGLVTGLSLSGNGLSGTIPSELIDLTELETLHLSGNSLSGCVPGSLYDVATNDLDSAGIPSCDQDKALLVALYNATGGASWTDNTNWLSDEPLGSWHGVTTDGNGLVTGLSLSGNGLSGTIPSELIDLTELETLHLSGNSLSGCVPGSLYDVATNDLDSAGIPSCDQDKALLVALYNATGGASWTDNTNWLSDEPLGSWHGVTTDGNGLVTGLSLANNGLSGTIPSELIDVTNLETLHLSGNSLNGCVPGALYDVTTNDLDSAGIPSCDQDKEPLVALYNATDGTSWTDSANWLSDEPLGSWHGVTTDGNGLVTGLSLANNGLSGTIPSELIDVTNLETLHLSGNSLSGCVPGALYDVVTHDLDSAGIPSCDQDKAPLVALYNATGGASWTDNTNWLSDEPLGTWHGVTTDGNGLVTGLSLANNGLSGTIPSDLVDLTNLETLHLSGNSLSGCVPGALYDVVTHDLDSAGIPSCDQDKAPLVALYNATGGASWTDSANWLSDEPLGTWHGVTTDGNGLVTGLSLANNGLSGTIPSDLVDLTNLETLHLNGNILSGCAPGALYEVATNDLDSVGIPSCDQDKAPLVALYNATGGASWTDNTNWLSDEPLGTWHGVTTDGNGLVTGLSLAINGLSGTIPGELVDLTNLETLYLSGNSLSGCVPEALYEVATHDLDAAGIPSCVEREVLEGFYNATDGANWKDNSNWLSEEPLGTWYGVTTDSSGRVKNLDLRWNDLSGQIPGELAGLRGLEQLILSTNELTGTIPTELGALTNLERLILSSNGLTGTIPTELGELTNLVNLDLDSNALTGTIPPELGGLTNLSRLMLDGNMLTGTIPTELGELTNLTVLRVRDNKLRGSIPVELGNLTLLKFLYLSNNELSGTIPQVLGNLPNLFSVHLYGNNFTGCVPAGLYNIDDFWSPSGLPSCAEEKKALEALYAATDGGNWTDNANWLSEEPLGTWHGVTTNSDGLVTGLSLASNGLSGTIPGKLAELSNLETLHLSGNSLSGCIPVALYNVATHDLDAAGIPSCVEREILEAFYDATDGANWKDNSNWLSEEPLGTWHGVTTDNSGHVTSLDLSRNDLSGQIPGELAGLRLLEDLRLSNNDLTGTIPTTLGALTNLKQLRLQENSLRGSIPSELGNLTSLRYLHLENNELSGTIPRVLGELPDLYSVRLRGNRFTGCVPVGLYFIHDFIQPHWIGPCDIDKDALESLYAATDGANWTDRTNWLSEEPLGTWYGVATDGNGRVTVLSLAGNGLSGTIPGKMSRLVNLETLHLSGNNLNGCMPVALYEVATHDLNSAGIPTCAEREALEALYTATDGANWNDRSNWLSEKPLPTWHGVTIDGNGYVTTLSLASNALSGTIPNELLDLTELETLHLSGNSLSGCVPEALYEVATHDLDAAGIPSCVEREVLEGFYNATDGANWKDNSNWLSEEPLGTWYGVTTDSSGRVKNLDLRWNDLSGQIPGELAGLRGLEQLILSTNELTGTIPTELGALTNLERLILSSNGLTGTIPTELGELTNLVNLDLDSNALTGTIPPELGGLTNLSRLMLDGNMLTGTIPTELGELTNLTVLRVRDNKLRGSIPVELGNLTLLKFLYLSNNELSGTIPQVLGNLPNLFSVHLYGNNFTGCVPAGLYNIDDFWSPSGLPSCAEEKKALEALYAATDGGNWTDNANWLSEEPLGTWHGVTTDSDGLVTGLSLASNGLSGRIPGKLADLTNLETLHLSGNSLIGCVPEIFYEIATHDLESAGIPWCDQDKEALVALYNATDGANWKNSTNWLSEEPLGTWYGVTTDSSGRVKNLDLRWNDLSGQIPGELAGLRGLEQLILSTNELTGTIPTELGALTNLERLILSSNGLTGTIPTELGELTNLVNLDLDSNALTGTIPPELGGLTNLSRLMLDGNMLTGTIPTELGELTNLTVLRVRDNKLRGSIPVELGNLTLLKFLYLSNNELSGTIPQVLGNLPNLFSVHLYGNNFTGCVPAGLYNIEDFWSPSGMPSCAEERKALEALYAAADGGNWTNRTNWLSEEPLGTWHGVTTDSDGLVTGLSLASNGLSGRIPGKLADLTNLETLHLSGNSLIGCVPEIFYEIATHDLESAGIPWCDQDKEALVALYNATDGANWKNSTNWLSEEPLGTWYGVTTDSSGRVKNLDLRWNDLSGQIPGELAGLRGLEQLILSTNELTGTIPTELGALTNLERLILSSNGLTGTIPTELGELTNLVNLDLDSNALTGTIPPELGGLTNLSRLMLDGNMLTGTIPTELGELTNLTVLRVRDNKLRGSIPVELGNLTLLKFLYLSNNELSGTIPQVLGNLPNLFSVHLYGNNFTGCVPAGLYNIEDFWSPSGMPSCAEERKALEALYTATDGGNWTDNANWLSEEPLGTWHGVTTDSDGLVTGLSLASNGLSGTIPGKLAELTNLETLHLSGNSLSGCMPGALYEVATHDLDATGIQTCADREILEAFYDATDGANWNNNTNWLSAEDVGTWHGVTADGSGRVTGLNLQRNALTGTIPSDLAELKHLNSLSLDDNSLSGSIPAELGSLVKLTRLSLNNNRLTGTIPPELANLTNLTRLYLSGNSLEGSIPAELENLTNLIALWLGANNLSGCVPDGLYSVFDLSVPSEMSSCSERDALAALYNATDGENWADSANWLSEERLGDWYGVTTDASGKVIELDLSENNLSGTIPSELADLSSLEKLNLDLNELKGQIPAELGILANLEDLYIQNNELGGPLPGALANLANLRQLVLYGNAITGTIPAGLGSLSNLTALVLAENEMTGTIPSELGGLSALEYLWLQGNHLRGAIPSEIGELTNLIEVYLAVNVFSGCVPGSLYGVQKNDIAKLGLSVCEDEEALTALYHATGGDNWTENRNWLSDSPLSDWFGVTTDGSGRVVGLDLAYNELEGSLPVELGELTFLKTLALGSNAISGTIPLALGRLGELEALRLDDNALSGTIPNELVDLTKLNTLRLGGNSLSGCIPEGLYTVADHDLASMALPSCAERRALAALYLATDGPNWTDSTNWMSQEPLGSWFGVTTDANGRVTALSLASNHLSGTVPSELEHLVNLQTLHLGGNELKGCLPDALFTLPDNDLDSVGLPRCEELAALAALYNETDGANWTNNTNWLSDEPLRTWFGVYTDGSGRVQSVMLGNNNLNGTIPEELSVLSKLLHLHLYSNRLSGNVPSEIGELAGLLQLDLSGNRLDGAIPAELGNLRQLLSLILDRNQLSGDIPVELGNLGRLSSVFLASNSLTGCVPASLYSATNDLHLLQLPTCEEKEALEALYDAAGGEEWTDNTNWLDEGSVGNWYGVTAGGAGRVRELDLSNNGLSGTIPHILTELRRLDRLYLNGNDLTGCIPDALFAVPTNDLGLTGLSPCTNSALAALYNETGGAHWRVNTNWLSEEPLGAWQGVTSNEDGKVTGLELANNELSGTIPTELGELATLQTLDLRGNRLNGSIPASFEGLTNLNELYLGGNDITGCVPSRLYLIPSNDLATLDRPSCAEREALEVLYNATDGANWRLNDNWLSDKPLGDWVGVTTDARGYVTALTLVNRGLTGSIPAELRDLPKLRLLELHLNSLTGRIPEELGSLSQLERLYLFNNRLIGSIPAELGNLNNLKSLLLNGNKLSGFIPTELGNLSSLQSLILDGNKLRGTIPAELGSLSNLEWLTLNANELSGLIPAELGHLTRLDVLDLSQNKLRGSIPSELAVLTDLQELLLEDNVLSGAIPYSFGNLTKLAQLRVSGNWLTGCVHDNLLAVTDHDLDEAGLAACTEREVLVALYQATDSGNWIDSTNWLSEKPLGEWFGVTTDSDGLVTGLSLASNGLSGTVPGELGDLRNLETLHLSGNTLTGCIPVSLYRVGTNDLDLAMISSCAEREILVALYRGTEGAYWSDNTNWLSAKPLGEWFGVTTDSDGLVTGLSLARNGLTGTVPAALGDLDNLDTLHLRGNPLSGCMPGALYNVATHDLDAVRIPSCDREKDALVALYNATDGENWTDNLNWLSEEPLGTWHGVTTDVEGQVTGLSLAGNRLSGTIPIELADLTNLETLHLSGNSLSGCMPRTLYEVATHDLDTAGIRLCGKEKDVLEALYRATDGANWKDNGNWLSEEPLGAWYGVTTDSSGRVIGLDLNWNDLSGEIPVDLADLRSLATLKLGSNTLTGTIPTELGGLTKLESLSLGGNEITGRIPAELGNLTNLVSLELDSNALTGTIPTELGGLTNLLRLMLDGNMLTGTIPTELGELTNLTVLRVRDNKLRGSIPVELGNLTLLKFLYLSNNELSGTIPQVLGNLPNLFSVHLYGNNFTGCVPAGLYNIEDFWSPSGMPSCAEERKALEALYTATDGGNWTDNANWLSEEPLGTWHGVTTDSDGLVIGLSLASNGLSGTIPGKLADLTNLETLHLSGNSLNGCMPGSLYNAATHDLDAVGIPSCDLDKEPLIAFYDATDGANWTDNTNWLSEEPAGTWHGVTTDSNGNVTGLSLASNALSGTIPTELLDLAELETLHLSGNSLSGCVPEALYEVATNDLDAAGIPSCVEREVLEGFYNATDGANWTDNSNWLSEEPVGTWRGVTTDASGRVTDLVLQSKGLSGTIPTDLTKLKHLVRLYLDSNNLSGGIPAELGSLGKLERLGLTDNRLTGTIPTELGNLSELRFLYLSGNSLEGSIPVELENLTKLISLWLGANNLSGCVPDGLYSVFDLSAPRGMSSCAEQDALIALYRATDGANWSDSTNWLGEEWLSEWYGVTTDADGNVTGLSLAGNALSGTVPGELESLANLETLHLSGNSLSGCIPEALYDVATHDLDAAGIPSCAERNALEALYNATDGANWTDSANWLSEEPVGTWHGVTTDSNGYVTGLSLVSNALSGTIPSGLLDLTELETLHLSGNSLSGCVPEALYEVAAHDLDAAGIPSCAEREALAALYNATDGANWTDNTNWLSEEPAGTWHGVTTDSNGNVTGLSLASNALSGTIPTELLDLAELETLHLSGNSLRGCVPDALYEVAANDLDAAGIPSCVEREVLEGFFNATDGANWTDNSNWLSAEEVGTWRGVTTDASGRVTELVLQSKGLSGTIPTDLAKLIHLNELYLDDNNLRGGIPAELGSLGNLERLGLTDNRLTGTIPTALGNLSELRFLYLSGNLLEGSIPVELENLTKLISVWLGANNLSGCVPDGLYSVFDLSAPRGMSSCAEQDALIALYRATDGANWSDSTNWLGEERLNEWYGVTTDADGNVTGLSLAGNALSGTVPGELESLANLETLHLSGNSLSGCIPASLYDVATHDLDAAGIPSCAERDALEALYHATDGANWTDSTNWLSEEPLSEWFGVTTDSSGRVTRLELRRNRLNGQIPAELADLQRLERLRLNLNSLSGTIPQELGGLPNLTQLRLSNNALTGTIPTELGALTNLEQLRLSNNALTGTIPTELGGLTNLVHLRLRNNQLEGSIPTELGNLTALRYLYLEGNQLSGTIPQALGDLPNLSSVWLFGNHFTGCVPAGLYSVTDFSPPTYLSSCTAE